VVTVETVALNPALTAPAGTVTEAGTVTALLLLARFTTTPPVDAVEFNVTMQLFVPAVLIVPLVQLRAFKTGTPVPVMAMAEDVPVEELLVRVNWPFTTPATAGLNLKVSVAV